MSNHAVSNYNEGTGSASALLTSLISFWKLDESTGAVRNDSFGSENLTNNNNVAQVSGKIGNASGFTAGSSMYLSHADDAALGCGDIDFSLACWVNPNALAVNYGLFDKTLGGTNDYRMGLSVGSTAYILCRNSLDTATASGTPTAGSWNLVVGVHDKTNGFIRCSLNNSAFVSVALGGANNTVASVFNIGAVASTTQFMDGSIDAAGLWKRALTQTDVTLLWNGGAGREYPFY
jgi:trimeric autotransporter adhesin